MTSFLDLHVPGEPLLIPNPWDAGSAGLFQALGAKALATTSAGFAATLGHADSGVTLDQVLQHCQLVCDAVGIPVSADLENGYAKDPGPSYAAAAATGLAGASIEDWSGSAVYPPAEAVERVRAARTAAPDLVLTGRAEGRLRGDGPLTDLIDRLNAYAEAGADVLYAPVVTDLDELRTLVKEVSRPVNALLLPGMTIPSLADIGIARISVGGQLAWAAWNGAAVAARDFLAGNVDWLAQAGEGRTAAGLVIG
ncbi:MAG: isocitrate lyase/phosphoenolpyruvate mutase family protein [Frankiales bacterium]|nr:isocitrate lyase/phosphoenolpyruvate mutase family protein [Frankiales bacterium]